MFLLTFDVIGSRDNKISLNKVFNLNEYIQKYNINSNLIEISAGDQLRIMNDDVNQLFDIVMYTFKLLNEHELCARTFVTLGSYELDSKLNTMQGDIFYKSRELELKVKAGTALNGNSIYYAGYEKSEEINLLFESFSKLSLQKAAYIEALYMYIYNQLNQVEVAKVLDVSQSTVNNQLAKSNVKMYNRFEKVITELIKEEMCKDRELKL